MKYCIVVASGMADYPVEELGGKTPLEAADTPNMDRISSEGRVGLVRTIPEGCPPESAVAAMSVFGYDPVRHYSGRAALEATAMGIHLDPDDVAFRCDLVTVDDDLMGDHSAGRISSREAGMLFDLIRKHLEGPDLRILPGSGNRALLVYSGGEAMEVECCPPQQMAGASIEKQFPSGPGGDLLRDLMERSRELLEDNEVNRVRIDLGENPANMLWVWGAARSSDLPSFREMHGREGAAIAAAEYIKGLALEMGLDVPRVPGATGYCDTEYKAKAVEVLDALGGSDVAFLHIKAADEAGHEGDAKAKVEAVERIDTDVLAPLLEAGGNMDEFRVMILPDHFTPVSSRRHMPDPVPFAMFGAGVESILSLPFTEASAQNTDLRIEHGHELLSYFLRE